MGNGKMTIVVYYNILQDWLTPEARNPEMSISLHQSIVWALFQI